MAGGRCDNYGADILEYPHQYHELLKRINLIVYLSYTIGLFGWLDEGFTHKVKKSCEIAGIDVILMPIKDVIRLRSVRKIIHQNNKL